MAYADRQQAVKNEQQITTGRRPAASAAAPRVGNAHMVMSAYATHSPVAKNAARVVE